MNYENLNNYGFQLLPQVVAYFNEFLYVTVGLSLVGPNKLASISISESLERISWFYGQSCPINFFIHLNDWQFAQILHGSVGFDRLYEHRDRLL